MYPVPGWELEAGSWKLTMDIKVLTDVEKASIGERQPLPERYLRLSDDEMDARIAAARKTLGDRVVILGHHYQRAEVIKFADYIGDSLKLARAAASTALTISVIRYTPRARPHRAVKPSSSCSAACISWRKPRPSFARGVTK